MEPLATIGAELSEENDQKPRQEAKKLSFFQKMLLVLFGIASFIIFLVAKLPDARIQNLLIAHIRIIAQGQEISFSAEKIRVGLLLGPSLKFYNVELKSLENDKDILKIDYLKIRPNLLSLLRSKKGGSFSAELMGGEASGSVSIGTDGFSFDLAFKDLSLGRATLLRKFIAAEVQGTLNGSAELDFTMTSPEKTSGNINLKLAKLILPPQSLAGFSLPRISASEATIEVGVLNGQAQFRNVHIGKDTKTDDIVATLTGDSKVERTFERSKLNAKASLGFSPSVMQALPLLDAIMGPAKGTDNKYHYRIAGTLFAPEAYPGQ